jgi:HK97 family phage prohead protease
VRAESVDLEKRTVDAVLATQQPAKVYDWSTGKIVDEVLLVKGAKFKKQVPLLAVHSRWSLDDVLGSVREVQADGENLLGRLVLASDPASDKALTKIAEGHLTDVSVGYQVLKSVTLEPGETKKVGGTEFTAGASPLRITTQWRLFEVSLVPVGADEQAKIREYAGDDKEQIMPDENVNVQTETRTAAPPSPPPSPAAQPVDENALRQQGADAERQRVKRIRELAGTDGGVPDTLIRQAIDEGWDEARATRSFFEAMRDQRKPAVTVGKDNRDNLRTALVDALGMRIGIQPEGGSVALANAEQFRGIGLQDVARVCLLRVEGRDIPTSPDALFRAALSIGSFPEILSASATKSLARGYNEKPGTFRRWAGRREVTNFKQHSSLRLSEFASMPELGDGQELAQGTLSESKETYQAKTHGLRFAITRTTFVNDDMGAFLDTPAKFGRLALRTLEKKGYDLLIESSGVGPTMNEDAKALFSTARTTPNYATGATTALSDAALSAAKKLMRMIQGPGGAVLNIMPRFLLVPPSLEATALKLTMSLNMTVASGEDATVTMPTGNIHQGSVEVVVEPALEAATNGSTAWYLIGDPGDAESLSVVYLRGNEQPQIERADPVDVLGIGWRVVQDVGAAALDWRGIVRMKGA